MEETTLKTKTIKYSFNQTIPVLFSYIFMGIAFGILLQKVGYNFVWAFFICISVYSGSMQFVLVTLLSAGTALPTVAIMTIFINSRYMFYGLSFVEKFKKMGKRYPFMVFSLTDETYSVLCSCKYPENIDEKKAAFLIAFMNYSYWITGSVIGALIGQLIPIDFTGIDFCMTALFVVIFIDQWKSYESHLPAVIGLVSGTISLLLLGPENFILPALLVTVTILVVYGNLFEKTKMEVQDEN